jgi:hypothetical protein
MSARPDQEAEADQTTDGTDQPQPGVNPTGFVSGRR